LTGVVIAVLHLGQIAIQKTPTSKILKIKFKR